MVTKRLRALLIAGFLMLLLSGTASAYAGNYVNVTVVDNGVTRTRSTEVMTVGEFLCAIGIELGEMDTVNPPENAVLNNQMRIEIERAFTVLVSVDGEEPVEVLTLAVRLHAFSGAYGKQNKQVYAYDKNKWYVTLAPGMLVELATKKAELVTETESIPFETLLVETEDLLVGEEEVAAKGAEGVKRLTYAVETFFGGETIRTLIEETVEKAPEARIIMVGIGELDPNAMPVFEYTKVITMSATAYTADYASTGKRPGDKYFGKCASGMTAQYGVVAVDPKVIPLHTKLYIEGYGFAIAGDTGGAIKGEKIDLFVDTSAEAKTFGRQKRDVYILTDQEFDLGIDLYKAVAK